MNRYFAIIGIALALTVIFVIRAERGKEWMRYQNQFAQQERCTAVVDSGRVEGRVINGEVASPGTGLSVKVPEIKQIYIEKLDLADRCVTCHLGIDTPSCIDEEEPFNTHPGILLKDHPVEKFGCTSCHAGQGLGTTIKAAHGTDRVWQQPILSSRYAYGYCGRCHKEPGFGGSPQLTEGKRLFRELNCRACHLVKGYGDYNKTRTPLSRLGTKVNGEWLVEYLLSPRKYWKRTAMPDYKFKKETAVAIAAYLMTLKGKGEPYWENGGLNDHEPSVENGRKLFEDSGCLTCHDVEGLSYTGAIEVKKTGPELTRVAGKVKRDWLEYYLKDPREYAAETRMPSFRFTTQEASDLAEYLFSFSDIRKAEPSGTAGSEPHLIEEGRSLVGEYNCAGCHEIEGVEGGNPGPELSNIGNKPINRLDYGENPPGEGRSLPNWLYAKVMTPHTFRPDSAKMPYPNINNPQADAIVTYLLTLTDDTPHEKYMVRGEQKPRRLFPLGGIVKQIFDEFKCLSCHPLGGTGEVIGPQLAFEGNRVTKKWMKAYFEKPFVIRPSLPAKMPKFKFTQEERERLAEHSSHILLDDRIGAESEDLIVRYGGDVKKGRKLFSRKLACIGCHSVEGKGGRIGPDLTGAGDRLNQQWLYLWLKNPQSFLPDTRMPQFNLSDQEIASLMSFILNPELKAPILRERMVSGLPKVKEEDDLLVTIEIPKRKYLRGENIFMRYCSLCHGERGDGRGYNARFLPKEPRNFTDSDYMSKKSDEDLFTVISGGGTSAGLSFLMPPWGGTLNKSQIQDVISYIRRF